MASQSPKYAAGLMDRCTKAGDRVRDKYNRLWSKHSDDNGIYWECKELGETAFRLPGRYAPYTDVQSEPDPVNSPSHYRFDGFEVIDIIKAALTPEQYLGYLKGNVLKYLFREPHKGNPVRDVEKAQWYLDRYHDILQHERKRTE